MIKFLKYILFFALFFAFQFSHAQEVYSVESKLDGDQDIDSLQIQPRKFLNQFSAYAELQGIVTSKDHTPFWLRANRFGSVPLSGISTSFIGRIEKPYLHGNTKLVDWGIAFEPRINVGNTARFILIEGYAKARLGIFQLKAGRSKDIMGITDSTLSVGAFAVAGNALGIPKVELAVPEFWALPIFGGLLSFKGNFVYGWFGKIPVSRYMVPPVNSTFLQKSLYGRLGKPNWRLNFYAGFNHQSTYGSEDKIYPNFNLTKFESFIWAVTGKTWVANSGFRTKLGNQLGSIDMAMTYDFRNARLLVYRQQFYDIGALAHLANVRDGLSGISLKNNSTSRGKTGWNKLVLEFFYSKNQAGELWSPFTPSGDESYYNNYLYTNGWSYKGMGIGTPFITPRHEARSNLRYKDAQFFVNNRVIAYHSGIDGNINSLNVRLKLSYSQNFGTFATSPIGSSLGGTREKLPPPYFEQVNQFSGYLELNRPLDNHWQVGLSTALDFGDLLYNSFGVSLSIKKNLQR